MRTTLQGIRINSEIFRILEQQKRAFAKKFGREPGPDDPIFFDPEADEPRTYTEARMREIQERICKAMEHAGINPAIIYAYRKTGRIVTKKNRMNLTQAELAEWNSAIDEYENGANRA